MVYNEWLLMNLVGGSPTPLKKMKANGKDDIRYIMEKKKCLKPPTRSACENGHFLTFHFFQRLDSIKNKKRTYYLHIYICIMYAPTLYIKRI